MNHKIARRVLIGTAVGCVLVGVFAVIGLRLARPLIIHEVLEHRVSGVDF